MKRIVWMLCCLSAAAPLYALADDAYVVADISLQAGPDPEYPSIRELGAGEPVIVEGCIDAFNWCDVDADGDRGWVPGSFLEQDYDSQRVLIVDYGPRIGIPVVTFSIGAYWEHHYHSRPFFGERVKWESRHIQPHAAPKPPVVANGPHEQRHARGAGGAAMQAKPAPQAPNTPAQPAAAPRTSPQAGAQHEHETNARMPHEPAPKTAPAAQPEPRAEAARDKHEPPHPQSAPQPKAAPPEAQHEAGQNQPPPHAANAPKQPPIKNAPKDEKKQPPKKDEGDKKDHDEKDHG